MSDAKQTKAQEAKFQLSFMIMMMNVGRNEEADRALQKLDSLLDELVEEGK